jgi:hypothetical protein
LSVIVTGVLFLQLTSPWKKDNFHMLPADTIRNVKVETRVKTKDDIRWLVDALKFHVGANNSFEWDVTIHNYEKVNANICYIIYGIRDPYCESKYLLTFSNRELFYERLIYENCEADSAATKYYYTRYRKHDQTNFTLKRYKKVVTQSSALDSAGHYKRGFHFYNCKTRLDSAVWTLKVTGDGNINRTKIQSYH